MASVVAEITAGGGEVFLIAAGPDHEVARAAKHLEILTPLFTKSDPPGALVVPLSWAAIVQLAATFGHPAFGNTWCPGPRLTAWIQEQQRLRISAGQGQLDYKVPEAFTPYPWQVAGADIIASLGGALITDEPRTGKTPTAVLGLAERAERGLPAFPAVVVVPASTVDPWVETFENWTPHLRAVAWRGPKRQALAGTADVYVTSYDTMRIDTPVLSAPVAKQRLIRLNPASVVADECHLLKNPRSARSLAFRRLATAAHRRGGARVALSGTPITHTPADLWPTLDALEPDSWPARERWIKRYCLTLDYEYADEVLGLEPAREPEFRLSMLGQHRRVVRADVMSHLPPKVYSVRTVDIPAEWRKVYDDFETQMLAELPDGSELSVMDVQSKFNFLSRLASAAADVEITEGPDVDKETGELKRHTHLHLKQPSWKAEALLEILDERCTKKTEPVTEQVLAYAPSRQLMAIAGDLASKAGYRVGYVWGGQTSSERTETVRQFQAGALDLVCATTGAGGVGITLWNAGTVVFLQRPWSLVESIQAEDRAEGNPNADRGTEVIDVVARHTIDTRVRAVLRERAGQLADLVQDPRIVAELLGGTGHSDVVDERKSA